MKKTCFLLMFYPLALLSQDNFDKFFTQGSLRVDFLLAGNNQATNVYIQTLKKEKYWGGSHKNLIDTLEYGSYLCKVRSGNSGVLIYSKGFCTLYSEWQTTPEAEIINKAFYQTLTFPFPREPVRFEIFERNRKGVFNKLISVLINPQDHFIQPQTTTGFEIINILNSGDPSRSVDIVFLAEGYIQNEMSKFIEDIRSLCDSLFKISPFREFKNRFNLYAVLSPSGEQGTDNPGNGTWRNTIMNSSFYTFNNERYLTTQDYWKVRDLAALVPYDQICILVNTSKYGGGGIYNHYNLSSVDHKLSPGIFIHEFGHSFGALGDEYFTSDVTYENFYPLDVEPWEPNLTSLIQFDKKWKRYITPGTPVPTPDVEPFNKNVGVFEGGGYTAKGIYRPQANCRMKSNSSAEFCLVCQSSIVKMIHRLVD